MSDSKKHPDVSARRGFLKGAILAGGAAAVSQSANATGHALESEEPTPAAKPETTAKYTETEHVRTYYRLARF